MSDHKKLSPSKAHRWTKCAGSVDAEAQYPDKSGAAAADGTHSHTLLELCLTHNKMPSDYLGQSLTDHCGVFTVTADRVARVTLAVEYVWERVASTGCEVISESKVSPAYFMGRDDMDGTCDIQLLDYANRVLEGADYKDGVVDVSPVDNEQLELYLIGILAGYKLPINAKFPFDRVRMTIIQPKLLMMGKQPIKSHEMSVSELLAKIGKYVVAAKAADEGKTFTSGEHCKYCKHAGNCSARVEQTMSNIGFPVIDLATQSANTDVSAMPPERIAAIIEAAPMLRQLIDDVEAEALRRLEGGEMIAGLKLVHGRGSSTWSLSEDEIADKLIKMGVPKSAVYETKLVSPAKAKKLTWTKTEAGQEVVKKLSDRQVKTLEQEYVAKLAGRPTVVLQSDPRNEIVRDASPMFSPVVNTGANGLPSWLS